MLAVNARARGEKQHGVGAGEGLILGASGLVSRQMKRGERGSVIPASAARLNARPADATLRSGAKTGCFVWKLRPRFNGWTKKSDVELVEALD